MEYRNQEIRNTFGMKVKANRYFDYASEEELAGWIAAGHLTQPYLHVGEGSNLLFLKDYEGVVLHSAIKGVSTVEETPQAVTVRVGAGMVWDDFVAYAVAHRWYGVENLTAIPGEVGAAAVQNIGAYGVEVKDVIRCVHTLNAAGERRVYASGECGYAYRQSLFKQPDMKSVFVTYVDFTLSKQPHYSLDYGTIRQELQAYGQPSLEAVRSVIRSVRSSKLPDPAVLGNAGSFFMNPIVPRAKYEQLEQLYPAMPCYEVDGERVKIPAGWLIDQCGWKGRALGPVAVHERQALVLVNLGGAEGADVVALAQAVQRSVRETFDIEICPEVNFIS